MFVCKNVSPRYMRHHRATYHDASDHVGNRVSPGLADRRVLIPSTFQGGRHVVPNDGHASIKIVRDGLECVVEKLRAVDEVLAWKEAGCCDHARIDHVLHRERAVVGGVEAIEALPLWFDRNTKRLHILQPRPQDFLRLGESLIHGKEGRHGQGDGASDVEDVEVCVDLVVGATWEEGEPGLQASVDGVFGDIGASAEAP